MLPSPSPDPSKPSRCRRHTKHNEGTKELGLTPSVLTFPSPRMRSHLVSRQGHERYMKLTLHSLNVLSLIPPGMRSASRCIGCFKGMIGRVKICDG